LTTVLTIAFSRRKFVQKQGLVKNGKKTERVKMTMENDIKRKRNKKLKNSLVSISKTGTDELTYGNK